MSQSRQISYGETLGRKMRIHFVEKQVTIADMTDEDTSQTWDFPVVGSDSPSSRIVVLGHSVKVATALTGGSLSAADCDLGTSDDTDALTDGADVFGTAVDGYAASQTLGIAPFKEFTGAVTFQLTINTTGNDLDEITAGDVTGVIYYAELI